MIHFKLPQLHCSDSVYIYIFSYKYIQIFFKDNYSFHHGSQNIFLCLIIPGFFQVFLLLSVCSCECDGISQKQFVLTILVYCKRQQFCGKNLDACEFSAPYKIKPRAPYRTIQHTSLLCPFTARDIWGCCL